MSHTIEIFATLGERLKTFGKDFSSQQVIRRAMEENVWFSREDILLAVRAIGEEFLVKEKLQQWMAAYPQCDAKRVAIIMAGNIPLVGFYDLLCVLMAGHTALIKPASKDRVMMEYITEQLRDICPTIAIEPYSEHVKIDMAIATGGDQAAQHFRTRYADIPTIIRGSRHSVAVLDGNESEEQLSGLQRDIFSYSGLGCRNISLIMLPKGMELHITPPTAVNEMMDGNYRHNRAMKSMLGIPYLDLGGYIAVQSDKFSDNISQINYCFYSDINQVKEWLLQHDNKLQCIATNALSHPRRVEFGKTQFPTLWDVADGIDVMKFLTHK